MFCTLGYNPQSKSSPPIWDAYNPRNLRVLTGSPNFYFNTSQNLSHRPSIPCYGRPWTRANSQRTEKPVSFDLFTEEKTPPFQPIISLYVTFMSQWKSRGVSSVMPSTSTFWNRDCFCQFSMDLYRAGGLVWILGEKGTGTHRHDQF